MSSIINLQSLNVGTAFPPGMQDGSGGLQTYVDQSSTLSAVNGAPSAGQFRSSIVNRAAIPDIAADLKVSLGVDRIMIQQIAEIQNEFGQSGERVFGAVNDDKGLIRFVGNWITLNNTYGSRAQSGSNITDYVEITFYGTGLNLLISTPGGTAKNIVASTDGGAEGSNLVPAGSDVLGARNYSPNIIIPVVSGLSLGLHTVKLRNNTASVGMDVCGFEVLNASASINVNPGSAYSQFKKNTLSSAISASYNATFDQILKDGAVSGSLGTRGARALVYLDTDGTIKKRAVAVNSAQANLSSADHTNEEVSRVYNWREFGAGRNDDFSLLNTTTPTNLAFTLDDGTTSLVGSQVRYYSGIEGVDIGATTPAFITFTFIGTGLDISWTKDGASYNVNIFVDGVQVGTGISPSSINTFVNQKIVSGLPYGTHTVKIIGSLTTNNCRVKSFTVYQPKKPSLPSGAIELADYNVMADFAAVTGTAVADNNQKPSGVLNKLSLREFVYVGTWTTTGDINAPGNTYTITSTNSDYVEYNFFGTGFSTHMLADSATYDFTVTIDGSLNSSGTARANASNLGGGSYRSTSTTTNAPCRIEFTGLSAANHKVRITKTAGTSMRMGGIDIITPIHSHKPNLYADLQNTLPVGSQSIGDSRKFSVVKNDTSVKYRGVAQGIVSSPTNGSTSLVPLPDMSLTASSRGNWFKILLIAEVTFGANSPNIALYVNGLQVGQTIGGPSGTNSNIMTNCMNVYLPAGVHKIDGYWSTNGATITASSTRRVLIVEEL